MYGNGESQRNIVPPLHLGVAFESESTADAAKPFENPTQGGYAYGRMGNPNVTDFEQWISILESGRPGLAWATSAGLSASAFVHLSLTSKRVGKGRSVVISPYMYGGTYRQFQLFRDDHGYPIEQVKDPFVVDSWGEAIAKTRPAYVFIETLANPTIDVIDIRAVAEVAHTFGALLVVDNTLNPPTLQRPLSLGADVVLHSVTKYMNGQSTGLGGAIVGTEKFVQTYGEIVCEVRPRYEEILNDYHAHIGAIMHPLSAWFAFLNRFTLHERITMVSKSAHTVAGFLDGHRKVKKVNYPFLKSYQYHEIAENQMTAGGGLVSFDLGSRGKAQKFVDLLIQSGKEVHLAPHLGAQEWLIIHPASTTHSKVPEEQLLRTRTTPGLIRMSVGLGDEIEGNVQKKRDAVLNELDEALKRI